MGVIATDTWTGTNGAGWPAQWTNKLNGTSTIQTNQGQLVANSTAANTVGRADLTGMAVMSNMEVYVEVVAVTSGVEQYVWVGVDADTNGETGFGNSPYEIYLQLNYNATAASSSLSAWQGTNTLNTATRTLTGGIRYGIRVRRYVGAIYMRCWDVTGTEPSAWDFTINVNTLPAASTVPNPLGIVSFGCQNGAATGARAFLFDNMTVNDLGTSVGWLRI